MPFSWTQQIEKALKHKLYRASRLSEMKNPDYLFLHPAEVTEFNLSGKSATASKRIIRDMEKRQRLAAPKPSVVIQRFNRQ